MNNDHLVFKEKIISFFSFNQHSYHAQKCLLIGTGSQMSHVAHGPLVIISHYLVTNQTDPVLGHVPTVLAGGGGADPSLG